MRVEAGEGRDQHEQRRARQVEIRHQHVDRPEAVAGRDEDVGRRRRRARSRRPRRAALSSSRSDVVPTATMRPPAARAALRRVGGLGVDIAPFGMHRVVLGVVGLDRQERAGADMQRHEMPFDAALRRARRTAPA